MHCTYTTHIKVNRTDIDNVKEILAKGICSATLRDIKGKHLTYIIESGRIDTLHKIAEILTSKGIPATYNPKGSGSSVGRVEGVGFVIFVRPKNLRFGESANSLNEKHLFDEIQRISSPDHPVDVIFDSEDKKFEVTGVIGAVQCNTKTKNAKGQALKADVTIKTVNGDVPISIKFDNADFYASISNDEDEVSKIAERVIEWIRKTNPGIIKQNRDLFSMFGTGVIAIEVDKALIVDYMFGADILNGGAILFYNYHDERSKMHNVPDKKSTYKMHVKDIIRNVDDINKEGLGLDYPVLTILNHSRKRLGKYKGLNLRLATKRRARSAKFWFTYHNGNLSIKKE